MRDFTACQDKSVQTEIIWLIISVSLDSTTTTADYCLIFPLHKHSHVIAEGQLDRDDEFNLITVLDTCDISVYTDGNPCGSLQKIGCSLFMGVIKRE